MPSFWSFLGRLSSRSNKSAYTLPNEQTGQAVSITSASSHRHSHNRHCQHDHNDSNQRNATANPHLPPMLRRPSTAWQEIIPPAPSTLSADIAIPTPSQPPTQDFSASIDSERQRQWDELEEQSKKHWEQVALLTAMLMSTPKLRLKTGEELKRSKFCNSDDCCPVCLDDYGLDQLHRELPCGHVFHRECIDSWLTKRVSCPVCKASVIDGCSELDRVAAKEMIRVNLARAKKMIGKTTVEMLPNGIKRSAPRPIPMRTPLRAAVRQIKTPPVWSPSSAPGYSQRLLSAERRRRVSSI